MTFMKPLSINHEYSNNQDDPLSLSREFSSENSGRFTNTERLSALRREMVRESNNMSSKNKVIPVCKVERLIAVNENLREQLHDITAAFSQLTSAKKLPFLTYKSEEFMTQSTQNTESFTLHTEGSSIREEDYNKKLIEGLRQQLSAIKGENNELMRKLQMQKASETKKNGLKHRIGALEQENSELKSLLDHKSEEQETFRNEICSLKFKAEQDTQELKEIIKSQDEELKNYRQRISELESFMTHFEMIQRDREIFEKALGEKIQEIDELKHRIVTLEPFEKENKILRHRYFMIRTAAELLKQQNEEQAKRMDNMQELVNLDEMLDVEISVRKLMEERDVLATQNERIKKPLTDKILELDLLQSKVSSELDEIQSLKKSLKQLDESQVLMSPIPFRNDFLGESGIFRDEMTKSLEARESVVRNFQDALKDIESVKDQMENMSRELKKLNDNNESEIGSNQSSFSGFSNRQEVKSYTAF